MEPFLNSAVNSEVGADKRLHFAGRTPSDPRIKDLVEHVLENGFVIIPNAFTGDEVQEAKDEDAAKKNAANRGSWYGWMNKGAQALSGPGGVFGAKNAGNEPPPPTQ